MATNSALWELLEIYRDTAKTEREKGTYFESLAKAYFENDDIQTQQFDKVWTFAEWAEEHGHDKADTGIDLVANCINEEGFCAIQCKFYAADHVIQKSDIDSFFTASGKLHFSRRILIDTTTGALGKNAQKAMESQAIPVQRIGLAELEESRIDWSVFVASGKVELRSKKTLRPHQVEALEAVSNGFAEADRGKLIMACGTGKTFASLKIAEHLAGKGGRVLFLVPSLSLMSQSVTEWTCDSALELRSFAVCSDTKVGKRKASDDIADLEVHDLAFPATTNASKLAAQANAHSADVMTVVFSTYQSIQAIAEAQADHGLPEFDLIICDEAHRTTGATLEGEDESNFVKVHDQTYIQGHKRLYMTATPRIFGDNVRAKAAEHAAELCSMDDEELYGKELFHRGFAWAVENNLLTDYKVIVLAVDEGVVSRSVQRRLADGDSELNLDDASKIIGCYKALIKAGESFEQSADSVPMRTALAFCKSIKLSKLIAEEFPHVVEEYLEKHDDLASDHRCELQHVDGSFNTKKRNDLLTWLKTGKDENSCRVLSNVRCLSEGVDVPALDAIMFLHPRKSQIDVVQSVGRVMRRSEGKNMGYVILPVGIPPDVSPEQALNDNERYRVVWQILNALRAHDERLDADINRASLGDGIGDRVQIVGLSEEERLATTAVVEDLPSVGKERSGGAELGGGDGRTEGDETGGDSGERTQRQETLDFSVDEFSKAIIAKIVKKCGSRDYWEDWATDIAKIAERHITRITAIVEEPESDARTAFDSFLLELRDDLNDSISESDAIEMLAQHIITRPVFDALFQDSRFAEQNPVSKAIQRVLDILEEHSLEKESESLVKFYDSVQRRASGIESSSAKQKLVVELYDKFFRKAFPLMTKKMGIVYTPVEVVDFILHSVNDVLKAEFDQTIGSKGVHVLDPFTGTGTFIARLIESGLMSTEELVHKYREELHANEIVLLAYYIAAINIEATYSGVVDGDYRAFPGITLCDTFDLFERDDLARELFPENSDRRVRLKQLKDIRVIVGNPPYSDGQESANDDAESVSYESLDSSIRDSYGRRSTATNTNRLYNSYIRAIRWSTERLGDSGIIAFVTNAGWLEGNAMDGLRKTLGEEFSSLYVLNLRGNARTSGELRRQEGGNAFGEGSRAPIAISILVKNPDAKEWGQIFYHSLDDYLNKEDKLNQVEQFGSVAGVSIAEKWQRIAVDKYGDWLNQRDTNFENYFSVGARGKPSLTESIFSVYSQGVLTSRDAWVYNSSLEALKCGVRSSIELFNSEIDRLHDVEGAFDSPIKFVNRDEKKIKWSSSLLDRFAKKKVLSFKEPAIRLAMYRPFNIQWMYGDSDYLHRHKSMREFFPSGISDNLAICISGQGDNIPFGCFLTKHAPDLQGQIKSQVFPLKHYTYNDPEDDLLSEASCGWQAHDAITEKASAHFAEAYSGEIISKEDIFYYVYGLLHSPDYRKRYGPSMKKQLPRIPRVKNAGDFWAFSRAGRELGGLHIGFEDVVEYNSTVIEFQGGALLAAPTDEDFRVKKMKFAGKRNSQDKTTVIYNSKIKLTGIPLEAYDYSVNGKSAIEWVMDRQLVKKDIASGIVNDANHYAAETVGDPAYPLKLLRRVVTVSMESVRIIKSLPKLELLD